MWVRSVSTTGALGEWSTSIVITITSTELPKEDNLAAIDSVVPASLPQNSRPQSDSEKDDVSQNDVAQSNTDADPSQAGSVSQEVSVSAPDSNQDIDIVMSRWALGA